MRLRPIPDTLAQLRALVAGPGPPVGGRAGPCLALALGGGGADLPPGGGGSVPDHAEDRLVALVELAQKGDTDAYAEIYDLYVIDVYRYLYFRVGSHALAEDLTSETFLRGLRRIDSFRWQGRDIRAWFFTIAKNLVADHVKSSRFRLEVSTADMLDVERADEGIEETVLAQLRDAVLLDAVRRLTSEQQECVTLRFLQGFSITETALAMGRSEGSVKQLQLRAVRALAKLVPDDVR